MIYSYWDLYVSYIDRCVRDNWANNIDPHHYEMEWNHFLPRCVFGDWPMGQWLTKRQHAIASALQTLAFRKNCMFGRHRHHIPKNLLELAWPYYQKNAKSNGEKTAKLQIGCHTPEVRSNAGRIGGKKAAETNKKNKTGIFDPDVRELSYKASRKPVQVTHLRSGKVLVFESVREASRTLEIEHGNLIKVCKGYRKQTGGYVAEYVSL